MRILFLPNWEVRIGETDFPDLQSADKYETGGKYWFFRYFPEDTAVDIIDVQPGNLLHKVEKRIKIYIVQAIRAFRASRDYDVVISHGAQSGLVLSLLRTLTFRRRPRHIIFDIGGMNGGRAGRLECVMIRFALMSGPWIVCHSRVIIENYRKRFPGLAGRSMFIPFGVDTEEFRPKTDIREERQVLSFGYAKRDYKTLVEAWRMLGCRGDTVLKIIGVNKLEGAEGCPDLEVLPRVPVERLKEEIGKSLFVVLPLPVYEYSYGQMSLLQSMSMGKAVMATKTPGTADYCTDLSDGGFIPLRPYDAEDMKRKMEMLLNDDALRKELGAKSRACVQRNFSEAGMGRAIYGWVEHVLHSVE